MATARELARAKAKAKLSQARANTAKSNRKSSGTTSQDVRNANTKKTLESGESRSFPTVQPQAKKGTVNGLPTLGGRPTVSSGFDESKRKDVGSVFVGNQKASDSPFAKGNVPTLQDVGIHSMTIDYNDPDVKRLQMAGFDPRVTRMSDLTDAQRVDMYRKYPKQAFDSPAGLDFSGRGNLKAGVEEGFTGFSDTSQGQLRNELYREGLGSTNTITEDTRKDFSRQTGLGFNPQSFSFDQQAGTFSFDNAKSKRRESINKGFARAGGQSFTDEEGNPISIDEAKENQIKKNNEFVSAVEGYEVNLEGVSNSAEENAIMQAVNEEKAKLIEQGSTDQSIIDRRIQGAINRVKSGFDQAGEQQRQEAQFNDQVGQQQRDVATEAQQRVQQKQATIGNTALDAIIQENPELAPYAPFYREMINANSGIEQMALDVQESGVASALKSFADEQADIQTFRNRTDQFTKQLKSDANAQRQRKQQFLKEQQDLALEQQEFQETRQIREANKQKREAIDQMTARLALTGGFGSAGGNREIENAERDADRFIIELERSNALDKRSILLDFKASYLNAESEFENSINNANNLLRQETERLDTMSFASRDSLKKENQRLYENYNNTVTQAKLQRANDVKGIVSDMRGVIKQEELNKIKNEEKALDRIEYLLNNYPRDVVKDQITELAKDVQSFDASILADTATVQEIEKARKSVRSSGSGFSRSVNTFLPTELQLEQEPEISFDDFIENQVMQKQESLSESMSPEKREKFIQENKESWKDQYNAVYVEPIKQQAIQNTENSLKSRFSQNVIDTANLVINGTYTGTNPIKNASKATGVDEGEVAMAVQALRRTGKVAETNILSDAQQSDWKQIRSEINKDSFYTIWTGATSAVSAIETALNSGGSGASDITAINRFQAGIVDPGVTVREGDVDLMKSAVAYADRVNLNYWKEQINKGAKLPQSMREEMLRLSTDIEEAYKKDFLTESLPRHKKVAQTSGLPESVVDDWVGVEGVYVSKDVEDFTTSLGY